MDIAIDTMFAVVAIEAAGLAVAGIIYKVPYDALGELATVDEGYA